ncbi:hypothetical protein JOE54_002268 [Brachybacterium tyrofermentans]|nr:hypothetical protein FM103_03395 [Corynebacterium xerosis]
MLRMLVLHHYIRTVRSGHRTRRAIPTRTRRKLDTIVISSPLEYSA